MVKKNPADNDSKETVKRVELLMKILSLSTLAAVFLHIIGFVIVNTDLLRFGVYDFSILRARFIAAGLGYVASWLFPAPFVALLSLFVQRCISPRVTTKPARTVIAALGFAIVFVMPYRLLYIRADEGLRALIPLFLWGHVCLIFWVFIVALNRHLAKSEFLQRVSASSVSVFLFLVITLFPYGRYVYHVFLPSLGGGSPIYVQFVVKADDMAKLQQLGILGGEGGGLTQGVQLLTQTKDTLIVLTQDEKAVSFDASAVQGIRYDAYYYQTAERYYQDGLAYLEQEQYEKAKDLFWKALLLKDDYVEARICFGIALMWIGEYPRAIDQFDKVLPPEVTPADPLQAKAYYYRARTKLLNKVAAHEVMEDLGEAVGLDRQTSQQAVERDPVFAQLTEDEVFDEDFIELIFSSRYAAAISYGKVGGEFFDLDKPEDAEWAYKKAIELATDPGLHINSARYHGELARIYIDEGEIDEAVKQWELASLDDTENPVYHYRLAEIYYSRGDFDNVVDQCTEAISDNPKYTCAYILRGNAFREQGQDYYDSAAEDYGIAISLAVEAEPAPSSDEALARYQWARLEARRSQPADALGLLEQAIAASSKYILMAAFEADFDALRADVRFAGLIYPRVSNIEVVSEESIRFKLPEPSESFLSRLAAMMQCEGVPSLIVYRRQAVEELIPGQARSWEVSDDGLAWTFELREDAVYTAAELAARLSEILWIAPGGGDE